MTKGGKSRVQSMQNSIDSARQQSMQNSIDSAGQKTKVEEKVVQLMQNLLTRVQWTAN